MRKALIIGIDYYEKISGLSGCINDAMAVKNALERHENGKLNFTQPKVMTCSGPDTAITKASCSGAQ